MNQLRHYDDEEAGRVARHFFENEYHDPGIQKWGGFRTGHWGAHLQDHPGERKSSK